MLIFFLVSNGKVMLCESIKKYLFHVKVFK